MSVSSDMITASKPRTEAQLAADTKLRERNAAKRLTETEQAQAAAAKKITGNRPTKVTGADTLKMPWIFKAPSIGIRAATNAKIVISSSHPDYAELVQANHGRYLEFREGAYATTDIGIARYIRESIRDGKMKGVSEDLTAFPLRCDHTYADGSRCEFQMATSTKKDRDALYLHFLNEHMGDMADRADLLHPIS